MSLFDFNRGEYNLTIYLLFTDYNRVIKKAVIPKLFIRGQYDISLTAKILE